MWLGQYSLEAHLNTDPQGTGVRDGTLLPTRHQAHLTLEPTFGFSESFAVGFMFLNAWEPGYTPQFAGWHTRYEENSRRVELRPIPDRGFERCQVVFNPVFERSLHEPGTAHGWNFEPALLLRWKRKTLSPSLEYTNSSPVAIGR